MLRMRDRLTKLWRDWRGFLMFVAVMLVFRSAIADWNQVPSGSMQPTILAGDRIVVDKLAYGLRVPFTLARVSHWSAPARGDVVTFPSPVDERLFVKRVVGVPGDMVELRRNRLIVNGVAATYEPLTAGEVAALPVAVPPGYDVFRERLLGSSRVIMVRRASAGVAYSSFGPVTVPDDGYLVLGDNRDNSGDFRRIGMVARERVLGRAHAIAFSLNYDNYYLPRFSRFFRDLP